MNWTIKFSGDGANSSDRLPPPPLTSPALTSLRIEILAHRIFSPPENAMMHFRDKIGKLFSSHEFFGKFTL